jgi:hypothetical protein
MTAGAILIPTRCPCAVANERRTFLGDRRFCSHFSASSLAPRGEAYRAGLRRLHAPEIPHLQAGSSRSGIPAAGGDPSPRTPRSGGLGFEQRRALPLLERAAQVVPPVAVPDRARVRLGRPAAVRTGAQQLLLSNHRLDVAQLASEPLGRSDRGSFQVNLPPRGDGIPSIPLIAAGQTRNRSRSSRYADSDRATAPGRTP